MKLLVSGAAIAVLTAGASFAQTQPETPVAPSESELTAPGDTSTIPAPEADAERDKRRMERRAERQREREIRWHRKMRDSGWRGWPHWRDDRDIPPSGAHFRIEVDEDGSIKFDVRCAANEPTQTCAEVMMRLFDRLDSSASTQAPQNETAPPPRGNKPVQ